MPIPTGSFGQSWLNHTKGISSGALPVSRSLPESHIATYRAPLGLYAVCLFDFTLIGRDMGATSYVLARTGSEQDITWFTTTTTAPGLLDTITAFLRESFTFGIGDIEFHYQFQSGAYERKGFYLSGSSEGPHLSVEPRDFIGSRVEGDVYAIHPGQGQFRGYKITDYDIFGNLYTGSFVTVYDDDSLSSAIARVATADSPQGVIAVSKIITDQGYIVSGTTGLIRNYQWDGGLFTPNSGTVAIYGANKDFLIPSGNLEIRGSQEIISGSLNVFTGSIYIQGPGVSFEITREASGSSLPAGYIEAGYYQPLSFVTRSTDVIDDKVLPDGALYLIPSGSQDQYLKQLFVRAQDEWFPIKSGTIFIVDGGYY